MITLNKSNNVLSGWSAGLTEFEPHLMRNLLNLKQGSIANSLSLSSTNCPDMTEILMQKM